MRISDWSSDVYSSDLLGSGQELEVDVVQHRLGRAGEGLCQPLHHIRILIAGHACSVGILVCGIARGFSEARPHWQTCWSGLSRAPPSSRSPWRSSSGFRSARSEEHTSELQSLMRISYAVFCLKKKTQKHILSQHSS